MLIHQKKSGWRHRWFMPSDWGNVKSIRIRRNDSGCRKGVISHSSLPVLVVNVAVVALWV